MLKDSGARREFETGAVRDICEGKGRCDLLPLDVVSVLIGRDELQLINFFQETGDVNYLKEAIRHFNENQQFPAFITMFLEVSVHFEEGAKKYSDNNWKKGIPAHCYVDSAVRHFLKHMRGDTDEPHDRAFVWNLLCCVWTCLHKPELNDYLKKDSKGENK